MLVDLSLLEFCRDAACDQEGLHAPHGSRARAVRAAKHAPKSLACADCGLLSPLGADGCMYCRGRTLKPDPRDPQPRGADAEASETLIDVTMAHIGSYTPRSFRDLYQAVVDDFGAISDRSVQRALSVLVRDRHVASLGATGWLPRARKPAGWYIRYDSPKLWTTDGLRDLMSVVADQSIEVLSQATRRPHAP